MTRHGLSRRVKKQAELRVRSSAPIHAPIKTDSSGHTHRPRTGKAAPIKFSQYQEWLPDVNCPAQWVKPGKGHNTLRQKMNMLDLANYEQPVVDENGKPARAKFEPIVNKLGNTPDVGEVEANVMANETLPFNQWAREMIWPNQES